MCIAATYFAQFLKTSHGLIALADSFRLTFTGFPDQALTKAGGERGIRTLDAPFETYMISNHALSTTQPSLHFNYSSFLTVLRAAGRAAFFSTGAAGSSVTAASVAGAATTALGAGVTEARGAGRAGREASNAATPSLT